MFGISYILELLLQNLKSPVTLYVLYSSFIPYTYLGYLTLRDKSIINATVK